MQGSHDRYQRVRPGKLRELSEIRGHKELSIIRGPPQALVTSLLTAVGNELPYPSNQSPATCFSCTTGMVIDVYFANPGSRADQRAVTLTFGKGFAGRTAGTHAGEVLGC